MKNKQTTRLWGAAFETQPSEAVIAFTAGRDVASKPAADAALLAYDLWVNKAHCVMLAKTGIIPAADAGKILTKLHDLENLVHKGKFHLDPAKEDVHTNVESWLTEKLDIDTAGKLHTARSRNDQVVTDMTLYLREQVIAYVSNSIKLVHVLLDLADQYKAIPFPGFTHHQHAMVTTFGHVLAGFAGMILRDIERFECWYTLHNQSPLGNAVSYGTSFPIDKKLTATLLAFDSPDHNSMDAVTNRWEPEADVAFAVSVFMNHLSCIAETLMLLMTPEFGMVKLSDQFSTGSSIMPQKKNPDLLEAIKGKAGLAQGQLVSLMSIGKGSFIGYNRDSQWTKYVIMDLVNECLPAPVVLSEMLETLTVNEKVMEAWCRKGFIGATTLMEQLVSVFHLPMRQAKDVVEKAVKYSEHDDIISYQSIKKALMHNGYMLGISEPQVIAWQDPYTIISLARSYGGPGKHSMKTSIKKCKKKLAYHTGWLLKKQKEKNAALALLEDAVASIIKP